MPLGRNCYSVLVAAPVEVEQVAAVVAPVADILAVLVALALAVADRLF